MLLRTDFDIPGALKQFQKAKDLALRLGLNNLAEKAKQESEQLQKQSEMFRHMFEESPAEFKKSQMNFVLDYLKDARKMVELESNIQKITG